MKRNKEIKRVFAVVMVLLTVGLLVGCRSQERFGQRKAPKGCNTCTRWGK